MLNNVIDWIKTAYGQPPNAAIFILLVSAVLSLIYSAVQVVLVDRNKVRIYNARIKKWREKYKKAMRSGNPRLISEVEKEKDIINRLQLELSQETFKPMIATFLLFIVVYYFIMAVYDHMVVITLPFTMPVPWFGPQFYVQYKGIWISGINAFWWYIFSSILISSTINVILKILGLRPY